MRHRVDTLRGSADVRQATSEEKLRLLSLVDVFEPLAPEDIEQLNGRLLTVYLEAGETFYTPEEPPSERMFLLCKGRVRLYKMLDKREFTLAVLEAGTVFGEIALTAQRLYTAYAQAMTPSEISVMHYEDLERLILEKPEVGLQMMRLLSERLRCYEIRLEDISLKDVTARLASLILLLLESEGVVIAKNYLKIPTHYTHQQLGTMVGANRAAITRAFSQLQDEGIVELRRRLIYVADIEALKQVAEGKGDWTKQPCRRLI